MLIWLLYPAMWLLGLSFKSMISVVVAAGVTGVAAGLVLGLGTSASFLALKPKNKVTHSDLIHAYSDIAATNWTRLGNDTELGNLTQLVNLTLSTNGTRALGVQKSFLYYQDPDGAIIVSSRNHPDDQWATVNITDYLEKTGKLIMARPGTAMAATSSPDSSFETVLHFMDWSNKTVEIRSKDISLRSWTVTDLRNDTSTHADHLSQLASHWLNCHPDCNNSRDGKDKVRVFFQKSGDLRSATTAPWVQTEFDQRALLGTAMAATPYLPPKGPIEMRIFFQSDTEKLVMVNWQNETTWDIDGGFYSLKTEKTFQGQSIAATSFPSRLRTRRPSWFIMVLQLEKKGHVKATYWDPLQKEWVTGKRVKFHGGKRSPKFTRIALTNDAKFYGLRRGKMEEYTIDPENPTHFKYSSRVAIRNKLKKPDV